MVIIGAPVHAGRLPDVAVERLGKFSSSGSPAAAVVVYGNREYEDVCWNSGNWLPVPDSWSLPEGHSSVNTHIRYRSILSPPEDRMPQTCSRRRNSDGRSWSFSVQSLNRAISLCRNFPATVPIARRPNIPRRRRKQTQCAATFAASVLKYALSALSVSKDR